MSLLGRGVEQLYPNKETFTERLARGPLSVYHGIDPTGPTLHLGHLSILLKLRDLQQSGHKVTILIGDFTATIGDPTDKSATRQPLSREQVVSNFTLYQEQIGRILDLSQTKFVYNNDWLAQLNLKDFLELTAQFTVSQLLERDMFAERVKIGAPIHIHEFMYPILQGYDSVVLDTDLEIGGNDQTFNMLVGRDLLKKKGKDKLVMSLKLLVDPTGKKMGKTENNMVALTDKSSEVYGKVMSWSDELMPLGFELCTRVPEEEIEQILSGHPRDAKMRLAFEITKLICGQEEASTAQTNFVNLFQNKGEGDDMAEAEAKVGDLLIDIVVNSQTVSSKAEYRRLLAAKAIKLWPDEEVITDPDFKLKEEAMIKVGKHRFLKIKLN